MPYVYSTLTSANEFAAYSQMGDQVRIGRTVRIEGGHGVMNRNLITPQGVATEVTDDELEFLLTINGFQDHVNSGFITYDQKKVDAEKVIIDMERQDGSAQMSEADITEGGRFEVKDLKSKK